MKKKTPVKRTRRLVPRLHKPKRHGTTTWTTWASPARSEPKGAHRGVR